MKSNFRLHSFLWQGYVFAMATMLYCLWKSSQLSDAWITHFIVIAKLRLRTLGNYIAFKELPISTFIKNRTFWYLSYESPDRCYKRLRNSGNMYQSCKVSSVIANVLAIFPRGIWTLVELQNYYICTLKLCNFCSWAPYLDSRELAMLIRVVVEKLLSFILNGQDHWVLCAWNKITSWIEETLKRERRRLQIIKVPVNLKTSLRVKRTL